MPGGESPTRRAPHSGGLAGRSPKPGDTRQDARGPSLAFVGREQRSLPAKSESGRMVLAIGIVTRMGEDPSWGLRGATEGRGVEPGPIGDRPSLVRYL